MDGNPASKSVLTGKGARLSEADAVVLCGLGQKPPAEADVQVRTTYVYIHKGNVCLCWCWCWWWRFDDGGGVVAAALAS